MKANIREVADRRPDQDSFFSVCANSMQFQLFQDNLATIYELNIQLWVYYTRPSMVLVYLFMFSTFIINYFWM